MDWFKIVFIRKQKYNYFICHAKLLKENIKKKK